MRNLPSILSTPLEENKNLPLNALMVQGIPILDAVVVPLRISSVVLVKDCACVKPLQP